MAEVVLLLTCEMRFKTEIIIPWFISGTDMVGKFTKPLTNRKEYETTTFECNCTVDDDVVSVQWHLNDVEIVPGVPHFEKFEFHDEGRKRIMIIKDCPMDFNNGTFKCTSDIGKKLCNLLHSI